MQNIVKKINWMLVAQVIITLALVFGMPTLADAQLGVKCDPSLGVQCKGPSDIAGAIKFVIYIMLSLAGLIAVFFLILGGFWYITSAGNGDQITKGKDTIINAIIGLVIIIFSFLIVQLVINQFSGTGFTGGGAGQP